MLLTERHRANRWFRNVQAGGIRAQRRGISLRTELILFLGILVLLATASLGSIAYRTSRTIIEQDAVRDVGMISSDIRTKKSVLIK